MQTSGLTCRARAFTQAAGAQRPAAASRAPMRVLAMADDRSGGRGDRGRGRFSRRPREDLPELKAFVDLPKPAHLVYIKPTVAVVAGVAERSSVGLKMTIGTNQLERYVIEYFSRSL